MSKGLANNNLLPPIVMVAIDTSNHLTVACLEIHWFIPAIHKASLLAAGSDMICIAQQVNFHLRSSRLLSW